MSKKKNKRKKKYQKKDGNLVDTKRAWVYETLSCKHPQNIKIGQHDVVLRGYRDRADFDDSADIRKLDVFIGLDDSWEKLVLKAGRYKNPFIQALHDKWVRTADKFDTLLLFCVPDRGVREAVFKLCVELLNQNKKIGFGCMGGHGRTGWLAARLIKEFEHVDGDEAIRRVRERYCKEAVESGTQRKDIGGDKEKGTDELLPVVRDSITDWRGNFSSYVPMVRERYPSSPNLYSDREWMGIFGD